MIDLLTYDLRRLYTRVVKFSPRGGKLRKGQLIVREPFHTRVFHAWGDGWVEFPRGNWAPRHIQQIVRNLQEAEAQRNRQRALSQ